MQAEIKTREQEVSPAGMAWIAGKQKPFYNPRFVKKGKNKGKIEIRYQKGYQNFRTITIRRSDITRLLPPWDDFLDGEKATS